MEPNEMTPREWKEARMKAEAEAKAAQAAEETARKAAAENAAGASAPERRPETAAPGAVTGAAEPKDILDTIASLLSTIFSPLLVPTYGLALALWTSHLRFMPTGLRLSVVLVTFIITCIIPAGAIFALWRTGRISDPGLNKRGERSIPYVITGLCYLGCALYLWRLHAPAWLWAFPAGGAIAVIIATFINTRWKISAHMAGMGGLVAVAFREVSSGVAAVNMMWWLTALIMLAGCVATSRLILKRHTLGQVLAGTALGFLSVYLLSMV